jgi:PAS domain-containing protein
VLVSGEPRFDSRGVFRGYWGVVRDVTEMHNARAALAATETRYEELFAHIPTPLVLHRSGRVIEANPAAVAMFGHADLKAMVGTDLLKAYQSGDSRERERRRLEALQNEVPGTAAGGRLPAAGAWPRGLGARHHRAGGHRGRPGHAGHLRGRHRTPGR